jgi:hypothetical protein
MSLTMRPFTPITARLMMISPGMSRLMTIRTALLTP